MAIFNSYVKLPEGTPIIYGHLHLLKNRVDFQAPTPNTLRSHLKVEGRQRPRTARCFLAGAGVPVSAI